ncbi:amino acid transporter, partial [Streptococcus pyogenes]
CVSFMLQYSLDTWIAFGIALVVGLVIYFTYGYHHSTLTEEK